MSQDNTTWNVTDPAFVPRSVVMNATGAVAEMADGRLAVSADGGSTWVTGEEAKTLTAQLQAQPPVVEPPYERVDAEGLKNIEADDFTFAHLCAFVDTYRSVLSPKTPVLLPGWNDSGLVAAPDTSISLAEVRDNPYSSQDGEIVRRLLLVRHQIDGANAVVIHHGVNFPNEHQKP